MDRNVFSNVVNSHLSGPNAQQKDIVELGKQAKEPKHENLGVSHPPDVLVHVPWP